MKKAHSYILFCIQVYVNYGTCIWRDWNCQKRPGLVEFFPTLTCSHASNPCNALLPLLEPFLVDEVPGNTAKGGWALHPKETIDTSEKRIRVAVFTQTHFHRTTSTTSSSLFCSFCDKSHWMQSLPSTRNSREDLLLQLLFPLHALLHPHCNTLLSLLVKVRLLGIGGCTNRW